MLMLTAYLDETGHAKDERQSIVGVAGLLAPASNWERFEVKWKRALKDFGLPYFHMKEFAHSTGVFEGWKGKELKRRKLFGKLMKAIETIYPIPVGATIPIDAYSQVLNEYPLYYFDNPYHQALGNCFSSLLVVADRMRVQENIALVLSEQREFRRNVLSLYDRISSDAPTFKRVSPVSFANMRDLVPLQAADVIAYELKKEHERRLYKPNDEPRYGYKVIVQIGKRQEGIPLYRFHTKETLSLIAKDIEKMLKNTA